MTLQTQSGTQEPRPPVISEHIAIKPGFCGGKPHIAGHRIKVQHVVVYHEYMGMSPHEIASAYPSITLADVYAALTYYHDHREEIEADIRESDEFAKKLEAEQLSLIEKIAAKRPDVLSLSCTAALGYVESGYCPAEDVERLRADIPRRRAEMPDDPDLVELEAELTRRQA